MLLRIIPTVLLFLLSEGRANSMNLQTPFHLKILPSSRDATATTTGESNIEGVFNGLGIGQDPSPVSIVNANGTRRYYFPTSDFSKGVYMQSSDDLNTVFASLDNEYLSYMYQAEIGTEAPDLSYWNDTNLIMYISSIGSQGNGTLRVLWGEGGDPLGKWFDYGEVYERSGQKLVAYDGHQFRHPINGKNYLMYSRLRSVEIAELASPTQLATDGVVFASGSAERTIEAPSHLIVDATLNIVWSENAYNSVWYTTFSRSLSTSSDPMDPDSWRDSPNVTILSSSYENSVYGPGSVGFFTGPQGDPWISYSCFYEKNGDTVTSDYPRRVQAQPVAIANEQIQFMQPVKPTRYLGTGFAFPQFLQDLLF